MTSPSDFRDEDMYALSGRDLRSFGFARVRDAAYDAVQLLWKRRKTEGWTQVQLADNLDCDAGWLSKHLKGPGNWTFKTFGTLVQGLHGTVEIIVHANEDVICYMGNHGPYSEYVLDVNPPVSSTSTTKLDFFNAPTASIKITPAGGALVK